MRWTGRTATVVLLSIAGLAALAAVILVVASSPLDDDPCAPGYEACMAAAGGVVGTVDCRIEMLHCRSQGPEHWSEVLGKAAEDAP